MFSKVAFSGRTDLSLLQTDCKNAMIRSTANNDGIGWDSATRVSAPVWVLRGSL